jgi:hypothetical protein
VALKAGFAIRVLGVPLLWAQLVFAVAAGSEMPRTVFAGTGRSACATNPSSPRNTERTSKRSPGKIASGSAHADSNNAPATAETTNAERPGTDLVTKVL